MLHLRIHPDNPQPRLISQAVERIRAGDVVVYPPMPLMQLVVKSVIKMPWSVFHKFVV